jgi:ppGpp synthetase/RelA/SpoT-type nucleotidyltranferase
MDIKGMLKRVDEIKGYIVENLSDLTPREISDYAIELSSINDTLGTCLARAERDYARVWQESKKKTSIVREADMTARNSNEYQLKRELEARIKSVSEIVNVLKKRGTMLELEARNQQ